MKKLTACLVVALALWVGEARGEWEVGTHTGLSATKNRANTTSGITQKENFSFHPSGGVRIKYWFPGDMEIGPETNLKFSLGADISYFKIGEKLELRAPIITPILASFRLPLEGQWYPYLFIGPGIFSAETRFRNAVAIKSATDVEVGLHAGAGLHWNMFDKVGLYTEYRVFYVNLHFPGVGDPIITPPTPFGDPPDLPAIQNARSVTHQLILGIAYRF